MTETELHPGEKEHNEKQMRQIGATLFQALLKNGFKALFLSKSHHGSRQNPDLYSKIELQMIDLNDQYIGIGVKPHLSFENGYGVVTLKMYRVAKTEQEQQKFADEIWKDVTDTQKRFLIERSIQSRLETHQATLAGLNRTVPEDGLTEQDIKDWIKASEKMIKKIKEVQIAFQKHTGKMQISHHNAELLFLK